MLPLVGEICSTVDPVDHKLNNCMHTGKLLEHKLSILNYFNVAYFGSLASVSGSFNPALYLSICSQQQFMLSIKVQINNKSTENCIALVAFCQTQLSTQSILLHIPEHTHTHTHTHNVFYTLPDTLCRTSNILTSH